jgi:DNA mismatch endonuclease (patch repair protein)
MRSNRSRDTKPELLVRRMLRDAGYPGYRLHWRKADGRPDIAYPGRKIAIFVNGCYWHRCPRCASALPKSNTEFWRTKFGANEIRDSENYASLQAAGWTVLVVWECDLKANATNALGAVFAALGRSSR